MFCMMMAPSVRAFLPSKFQTSVLVGPSSTILGGASVRHANARRERVRMDSISCDICEVNQVWCVVSYHTSVSI